jgi:hypothetical protein
MKKQIPTTILDLLNGPVVRLQNSSSKAVSKLPTQSTSKNFVTFRQQNATTNFPTQFIATFSIVMHLTDSKQNSKQSAKL